MLLPHKRHFQLVVSPARSSHVAFYEIYHVNGIHVDGAFTGTINIGLVLSQGQLVTVTSTSQNCCSIQRFLCFYLDFEIDISSDTVDLTRDLQGLIASS
jgi:hypothetical protein